MTSSMESSPVPAGGTARMDRQASWRGGSPKSSTARKRPSSPATASVLTGRAPSHCQPTRTRSRVGTSGEVSRPVMVTVAPGVGWP